MVDIMLQPMQHRNKSLKTRKQLLYSYQTLLSGKMFCNNHRLLYQDDPMIKSCKTDVYSVTNSSLSNLQALLNNTVEFTPKLIIQQKSNVIMALNLNDSCITSLYKPRF